MAKYCSPRMTPKSESPLLVSAGPTRAGWPGRYPMVWRYEGLFVMPLELKDPC